MAIKVAINGFGRIGRCVTRLILGRSDIELVAINDIASIDMMCYLLENDSVHGSFLGLSVADDRLIYGDKSIKIFSQRDPQLLDFASLGVDVVLECSGLFLTSQSTHHHIDKGAKKVIFSAPTKDNTISTYVIGVNEHLYANEPIISNASCTTNALAPIAKILDEHFGIEKGLMSTIHSYTNGQSLIDSPMGSDKRRSRAAGVNMVPTTTGAAKALSLVLPNLEGKLHGQSVRVPTADVSMVDLTIKLAKKTSADEINELFRHYSTSSLDGILEVDDRFRVSSDFIDSSYSSIVASDLTQVIDGDLAKVMAWYDNEWGYSNRLIEMALYITSTKK